MLIRGNTDPASGLVAGVFVSNDMSLRSLEVEMLILFQGYCDGFFSIFVSLCLPIFSYLIVYAGTNAHKEIPSHHWRILHLFVCPRLYQSFLDSHYVGWAASLPEASTFQEHHYL